MIGIRLGLAGLATVVLLAGGPRPAEAQIDRTTLDPHVCDDCHKSHDSGPSGSALVRRNWSVVAPSVTGLGTASGRCLQCHGTRGDRQQVGVDGRVQFGEPTLLGGSLVDDHPLGTERRGGPPGEEDPWDFTAGIVWDPLGLPGFEPGASVECESCHDPHSTQSIVEQGHTQDAICVACHDPALDYNAHGIASCGSCHQQHGGPDTDYFLREPNPNYLCGACHRGAVPPLFEGIDPIPGSPLHDEPSDPDCAYCHRIHPGG